MKIFGLLLSAAALCPAADADGKAEMKRECIACHSLRIIESQRLSATAWGKELDKMAGWGAVISDRQVLLDYLASEYSNTKPVPKPESSQNGVSH